MMIDQNLHGHGPWGRAFALHADSFEAWMRRWLDGEDLFRSADLIGEPVFWFEEQAQPE